MTRKVIIRMKNFPSEKKGKQFGSFNVMYLTPWWDKYRKWGRENASCIKLSQAQTGSLRGWHGWYRLCYQTAQGLSFIWLPLGSQHRLSGVCKEGAASLKVRKNIMLLEWHTVFHSPARVHLSAKLPPQQLHDEVPIQKSILSVPPLVHCLQLLLLNPVRIIKKVSRSEN